MVVGYTDLLEPDDEDRGDDLRPVERIRDRAEGMLALTERVREVEASLDAPDHVAVRGTDFLDSVFDNLVENAIEHDDGDDPGVRVAVTTVPDAVTVTVSDDGPGIPESELDALDADRESQLEHTSGFGLWLVEESGGDIGFDADGSGTTVSVHLPPAETDQSVSNDSRT